MLNENNNTRLSQLMTDYKGSELLAKLNDYYNDLKLETTADGMIDLSTNMAKEKIECMREIYTIREELDTKNNIEGRFDSENTFIVYKDVPIKVSELEEHCDHEKIENVKIDEAIMKSVSVPVEMHKKMIGENPDRYMSVKDVEACLAHPSLFLDTKDVSDLSDLRSLMEDYKNSKVRDMIDGDRNDPYLNLGRSEQKILKLFGRVEWDEISNRLQIPKRYYTKYADNMNWTAISKNQKLEVEFIKEYSSRIDFNELSKNPFITSEIIYEFSDRLDPKEILDNPKVDDEVKKDISEKGYIDGRCSVVEDEADRIATENKATEANDTSNTQGANENNNSDSLDKTDKAVSSEDKEDTKVEKAEDEKANKTEKKPEDEDKSKDAINAAKEESLDESQNDSSKSDKNDSLRFRMLNKKIKALEAKIELLEKKVEALEEKRDVLEKENNELKEKIDTLIEANNDRIAKEKLNDFETRLENGSLTSTEAKEFISGNELIPAKDIDTLVDKKLVSVNDIVEHQQVTEDFFENHKDEIDVELFKKYQDDGSFSDEFKEKFKEFFEGSEAKDGLENPENENDNPEDDEDKLNDEKNEDNTPYDNSDIEDDED